MRLCELFSNVVLLQIISEALRDLAKFKGWKEDPLLGDEGNHGAYLADDPVRDDFTAGLERTLSAMPDSTQPIPSSVWNGVKSVRQRKGEIHKEMQI